MFDKSEHFSVWKPEREGECLSPVPRWFFLPAEYSYTYKWGTSKRLAVGSLPAARCAESNVYADHKPSGCSAIYRPRIPCCRRTDRLGKSESFKNNSELKCSVQGRAASGGKPSCILAAYSWNTMTWREGVPCFSHCCFRPGRTAGLEGLAASPKPALWLQVPLRSKQGDAKSARARWNVHPTITNPPCKSQLSPTDALKTSTSVRTKEQKLKGCRESKQGQPNCLQDQIAY